MLIKSEVTLVWPDAIKVALKRDWALPKIKVWEQMCGCACVKEEEGAREGREKGRKKERTNELPK